jgi:hypothetical protein
MHLYQKIYEFAASAGAFEGYVYRRPKAEIDMQALSNWVDNLYDAYQHFSPDILDELQSSLDQTVGRAFQSLVLHFKPSHVIIKKLKKMIKGELPQTPDDFQKQKWFQG